MAINAVGRPPEYDPIKIGQDMVKWATDNPKALTIPMYATSIGLHSGVFRNWCRINPEFYALYMKSKELIGLNRLKCTQPDSEFIISDSLYSKTLHYYDIDIKTDIREDKEFESSLREKEAGVVQSSYNIQVNHDLAAGANLPTQGLSEGDNKGSQ